MLAKIQWLTSSEMPKCQNPIRAKKKRKKKKKVAHMSRALAKWKIEPPTFHSVKPIRGWELPPHIWPSRMEGEESLRFGQAEWKEGSPSFNSVQQNREEGPPPTIWSNQIERKDFFSYSVQPNGEEEFPSFYSDRSRGKRRISSPSYQLNIHK